MQSVYTFCLILGILLGLRVAYKIHTRYHGIVVNSMNEVQEQCHKLLSKYKPQDILCLFDIDMTLLQPDHPATYIPNIKKHFNALRKIYNKHRGLDYTVPFMLTLALPQHIIDPASPQFIAQLQSRGVKTIAFTASLAGPIDQWKRAECMRYEQLCHYGMDFNKSFKEQELLFDNCPKYRSSYPCFYRGVLCSNGEKGPTNKGSVLKAFLERIQWTPKCIILIDDRNRNLKDVDLCLKKDYPQIQFVGIEFQGARHYCPIRICKQDFERFWRTYFDKSLAL